VAVRWLLFAVWLVDYAVDVKRSENSGGTIVSDYDNTVAAWGDKGVISCRNGIFSAVRSANDKRYERSCYEAFTDINNHTAKLYQKLPFPHHLLAVEPDVEIPANAVDMRFGSPVRAGVLGVGMTKRDMDSGNLFVL